MDKLKKMIQEINLPCAYSHFAPGASPKPPFMLYTFPSGRHYSADGKVYHKEQAVDLELYTDVKSVTLEEQVEAVLDRYGIFYEKFEVWIESEKLYEVLYEFTI